MNVASLENCEKLFKLSGWEVSDHYIQLHDPDAPIELLSEYDTRPDSKDYKILAPAYDLGYLLRKLPKPADLDEDLIYRQLDCGKPDYLFLGYMGNDGWSCQYQIEESPLEEMMGEAALPEDAACLLAIKLFEEGILTRDTKGNV